MDVFFVIAGVGFVAFGGLVGAFGLWALRSGISISESDPIPIAETVDATGPVEFEGVASDEYTFDAPFSGREAVVCRYRIRERKRRGSDREKDWRTVERGAIDRPFVVEDDSGRVAVDPTGATRDTGTLQRSAESVSGGGQLSDSTRLRLSALTDAIDDFDAIRPTSNRRRYDEGVIEPGDDVHIYGGVTERTAGRDNLDATVSNADGEQYRITAGDESDAVGSSYQLAFYSIFGGCFFGLLGIGAILAGLGVF